MGVWAGGLGLGSTRHAPHFSALHAPALRRAHDYIRRSAEGSQPDTKRRRRNCRIPRFQRPARFATDGLLRRGAEWLLRSCVLVWNFCLPDVVADGTFTAWRTAEQRYATPPPPLKRCPAKSPQHQRCDQRPQRRPSSRRAVAGDTSLTTPNKEIDAPVDIQLSPGRYPRSSSPSSP